MREIHLVEVKYCEDTRPGHQLEASGEQHEVLCKRLKAKKLSLNFFLKKVILHTILLGVGGSICTSHALNHLKELGLDVQKAHETALKVMLILCSMHINCQLLDALLKNPVALKVLVWSRRLVTLQILTCSSFSLVKETHGSSGQCVSFSLIDVGSGLTAYIVFLFFLSLRA